MRVLESLPHSKTLGVTKGLYGIPDTLHGKENSDVFLPGIYRKSQIWTREESVSWVCTELEKLKINYTLNN
jgi:hypothetical protein